MGWTRTGADVEYWDCGHKAYVSDKYPEMQCPTCTAMSPEAREAHLAKRKRTAEEAHIKPLPGNM